ncbi:hypothetical protein DB30_07695 [Enhygromyxa salina]|uniref:Uncharacterized protein n=1 Tax=Enhygromyxa salina TaxID=215803 RepID=A0A0C2DB39_9BACT|nr:hypothetical protein [Enhygromyxa salina]KIG18680.1 hypothetical protein DB30_07695 [Enhygromyxa salina]
MPIEVNDLQCVSVPIDVSPQFLEFDHHRVVYDASAGQINDTEQKQAMVRVRQPRARAVVDVGRAAISEISSLLRTGLS